MLIGVLGRKGSGKDTLSDYVCRKYGYKKMAFATPLKEACKILFNFTDEQVNSDLKEVIDTKWSVTPRQALQYLGTDVFRNDIKKILPDIDNNFWVKSLFVKYTNFREVDNKTGIIISDVRFQNEIDYIHKNNGIIIKLTRPNNPSSLDAHESEKNIDNMNGDYTIINDGTIDDLFNNTDNIVKNVFTK